MSDEPLPPIPTESIVDEVVIDIEPPVEVVPVVETPVEVVPVVETPVEVPVVEIDMNQAYTHLKTILVDQELTAHNVVTLTVALMRFMSGVKGLSGVQRKYMVISALKRIAAESSERDSLNLIIDTVVPVAIDTIVNAVQGGIKFSDAKRWFSKFKLCC